MDTALERAFTGQLTAKQAMDQATEEANRVLRDYNRMY